MSLRIRGAVLLMLSPLLATLQGCGSTREDALEAPEETLRQSGVSFEEFQASVYQEPASGIYIVDGDTPVLTLEHLRQFYLRHVQAGRLIVGTSGGADMRWDAQQALSITYCVSTDFGPLYGTVVQAMADASDAWEQAARVDFIYVASQDANCTPTNEGVIFDVAPAPEDAPYLARAFFPGFLRAERNILIHGSSFSTAPPLTLTGILRHELGHALGFRHEHTRPEPGACFEDNNWRPLTAYDAASVMHYPQCNGTGDWSLVLTERDRAGAQALYGAASLWQWAPGFTPPFHLAADGFGDLGARFVDLNGDGKQDFVFHRWINTSNVQQGAYLSTGTGWQWAPGFTPPIHIAADGFGDLGTRFVDLNGDGKQDFVFHRWISASNVQQGAYLNTGTGWQWAPDFTPPAPIAADGFGDLGARFVDLNGDGKQDFAVHRWIDASNVRREAYLSTGTGWQWAPDFSPPAPIAADGFGDLGARFVDLNGDGKQDFVFHRWINASNVQRGAYLSTGTGWQWAPDFSPPAPIAADGFGDLGRRFVDLNGDGKQDFVFHRWISASNVQRGAYLSTGTRWQWAPDLMPPFRIAADGQGDLGTRFADLNGDGKQDFVLHRWINAATVQSGAYLAP